VVLTSKLRCRFYVDLYTRWGSPLLAACGRDQFAWMSRASRPLYNLYCEGPLWFMVLLFVKWFEQNELVTSEWTDNQS
jgi:hypothetical protein